MEITTRYATAIDAEAIALLSRQTFYETFAALNSKEDMDIFMDQSFAMATLIAEVLHPNNIFILAHLEHELVGYSKLSLQPNPTMFADIASVEISRLYAVKAVIGKGIGKILMEKCIEVARQQSKLIIWLGVWEHNQRAISFYQKFGFDKFGEHDFILGRDVQKDWLMKKVL